MTEVITKKDALLRKISELLETTVTPETVLDAGGTWDSMAVVVTISLIDEICGVEVDGPALSNCESVADVLKLAGVES